MSQGASITNAAAQLTLVVADWVAKKGDAAGFLQYFDSSPERDGDTGVLSSDRLDRRAARQRIAERIEEGFTGFAVFVCLEPADQRLWAEGFDSRPDDARQSGTVRSVSMFVPLKQNWRGKWASTIQGVALDQGSDELACLDESAWRPVGSSGASEAAG